MEDYILKLKAISKLDFQSRQQVITNIEAKGFALDYGTEEPLFSNRVVHTENTFSPY